MEDGDEQVADLRDGQGDRAAAAGAVVRSCRPVGGCVGGDGGDGGEEGQREHGECDVRVRADPVPYLVVVQADLALCGLEAFFDAPAGAGHADEFGQGCCGG